MSQLSKILGAYAPGHKFTSGGKEYTFGPVTQQVKDQLAKLYFKRARESVYAMKGELEADDFRHLLDRVTDNWTKGRYNFPSEDTFNFYLSPEGMPHLLSVLLSVPAEEAAKLLDTQAAELTHMTLCVVLESFPDFRQRLRQLEDAGRLKEAEAMIPLLFPSPPLTPG